MKPKEQIREALEKANSCKCKGLGWHYEQKGFFTIKKDCNHATLSEALTLLDNCVVIPREDLLGMKRFVIPPTDGRPFDKDKEQLCCEVHNTAINTLLEEYGDE